MQRYLKEMLAEALNRLQQQGKLSAEIAVPLQVERTRDKQHGDFACNIALLLAKATQSKPRELAESIVAQLPPSDWIQKVTVAGPGFINFFIADKAYYQVISEILTKGHDYGRSAVGAGQRVNMEYVSANPNGPLHVGHGRGAAYGATVANLLEAVGFTVHREYYVNDAGRQMHILAVSVWLRYLEELGETLPFPSNSYKGDYVREIARQLKVAVGDRLRQPLNAIFSNLPPDTTESNEEDGDAYIDALIVRAKKLLGEADYQKVFDQGLQTVLADIREDLAEFGVAFQEWFSESQLVTNGTLRRDIDRLRQAGYLYEKEGALWFAAMQFGDEKDRVVVRKNGQSTYFASDIAYHLNKFERGFDRVIDIMGADHHGYAPRINAFLKALGMPTDKFIVLLVQFASLYRGKEKVQMSTRSGSFVTLRELRKEVGNDAARFFYIMRKPEQHLDFDLELAKSQSNDNPVYYIQYAYARICSVMQQLAVRQLTWDQQQGLAHLSLLDTEQEQDLLRFLARYPEIIETAALDYEPHLLAHYLQELAYHFHTYYNASPFLVEENALRNARLCLVIATRQVIANGLQLLGLSAPENMTRQSDA
ncbi:MAG: arginine--tRNA ligase [Gammaproteobacteria bacterium]